MSVPVRIIVLHRQPPPQLHKKKENDLISENRGTEATLVLTIPRSCLSRPM